MTISAFTLFITLFLMLLSIDFLIRQQFKHCWYVVYIGIAIVISCFFVKLVTSFIYFRLANAHGLYHHCKANVLLVEYRGFGKSRGRPSEGGEFYKLPSFGLNGIDYFLPISWLAIFFSDIFFDAEHSRRCCQLVSCYLQAFTLMHKPPLTTSSLDLI